jgi:hypothetical protein
MIDHKRGESRQRHFVEWRREGLTILSSHADDEGNESSRSLGLVVVRGTLLVLVSPVDGSEEIANPFVQQDDD